MKRFVSKKRKKSQNNLKEDRVTAWRSSRIASRTTFLDEHDGQLCCRSETMVTRIYHMHNNNSSYNWSSTNRSRKILYNCCCFQVYKDISSAFRIMKKSMSKNNPIHVASAMAYPFFWNATGRLSAKKLPEPVKLRKQKEGKI